MYQTQIISNAFDDEEFQYLITHDNNNLGENNYGSGLTGKAEINISIFRHNSYEFKLINDVLNRITPVSVTLHEAHILTAYHPYMAHTDGVLGEYGLTNERPNGLTYVTPLYDFDSHTLTFNQTQKFTKNINLFLENNPKIDIITDEFYERYLTHENRDSMRYFSVETMFKWRKNHTLIMDRHRWHGSDNFHVRIPLKKALICWTTI